MSRHPRRVEKAVNRAAREASWLEPQDGGAVVVARALAEQLAEGGVELVGENLMVPFIWMAEVPEVSQALLKQSAFELWATCLRKERESQTPQGTLF